MTDREKIVKIIRNMDSQSDTLDAITLGDIMRIADALIAEGIRDVKEIKYRVRRAEKALYIACRETAEIIFKDDFDRHAQEYMYGYLKQSEKELAEEGKND